MTIARIRTVFLGVAGTPWYSNIHFADDGGTPVGQAGIDAVDALWTAMASNIANNITWTVLGEVAQINEADGKLTGVTNGVANSGAGTSAGDMLPFTTQLLGRQFTNSFVNGRRLRGRIFLPGCTEDANTDGAPIAGIVTNFTAAMNALKTSMPNWVVWARPFEGDPTATPPKPARVGSYSLVATVATSPTWASLRSRRD